MAPPSDLLYTVLAIVGLPIVSLAVYNVYFHSLSRIPGPALWASSPLRFVFSLIKGTVVQDVEKLHRQYGPVVRISPNEVAFARPEAWNDILNRGFAKDPIWWKTLPGQPQSIINAGDEQHHRRMRKLIAKGFTGQALRMQEPIVQRYADLLVKRLYEQAIQNPLGFDIVSWLNFTTFDIFGDLGFGESFDCLLHSRYHPWVDRLFKTVKALSFVVAVRFYPWIEVLLMKAIPQSFKDVQQAHFQEVSEKVERRLAREAQGPDLISHVIQQNRQDPSRGMSRKEIDINLNVLTTAGSETTATCLSGIFNHLISHRVHLDTLTREVRTASMDGSFTLSALNNLPYLDAMIQEGLRCCTPVPVVLPRLVPKGGAEVCGIWLPEDTSVSLQVQAMYRDPIYFHRATEFLPERWLLEAQRVPSPFYQDKRHVFQPFNVGSRSCLGRSLAWAEMRLVLARVLWHFDIESSGKVVQWDSLKTFLLLEKRPVVVKLRVRADKL